MYATTTIPALAFRNECGRRGCGHVFEYDGPNPLGNIQRLVREHSAVCRGQRAETTSLRTPYRGGSSSPSSSGSTTDDNARDIRSPSPSPSRATRHTSTSTSTAEADLPGSLPSAPKKSARTEAERRLALESDPCALRVTPHDVLCAGCRRTIKLDRRSRYYPGLWEKHRERCEGVAKIEERPVASTSSSSSSADTNVNVSARVLAPRKSYYRTT
ncbi:hypothetical protein B0H12DRAFT_1149501 [Mycena haematopus]|nr:hypothetical protein B0H12DRAFT_1149501 [Mycena haematopus]